MMNLMQLLLLRIDKVASQIQLDRCSLAQQMDALGVPRHDLARWVFLAADASDYRTQLVSQPNASGIRSYGIFQLDNLSWCQERNGPISKNLCKMHCDLLLSENIRDSVLCAEIAKYEVGWLPWPGHRHYLFAHPPSIDDCFEEQTADHKEGSVNGTAMGGTTTEQLRQLHSTVGHNIGVPDLQHKSEFL